YFRIPRSVLTVCLGKSTYARCGIIVNVTPLEPEWEGHVTLEFSNTTPLPAKIYANEGVAQMLFFESDEVCEISYKDRGGKYQGQRGVTLPKTLDDCRRWGEARPNVALLPAFSTKRAATQAALFLTITLPPASLDPVAFQHQPQGLLVALFLLDLHRQVADGGRDPHAQLLVLVAIDAFDTHGLELARRGDDGFPA